MHAVITCCNRQYRVAQGDIISVDRLDKIKGDNVTFDKVLVLEKEGSVAIGTPVVAGATVTATVVAQDHGPKVIGGHFRRRKGSKKKFGSRRDFTRIKIDSIVG